MIFNGKSLDEHADEDGREPVSEADFDKACEAMKKAGKRDGKAAGGWIADGNTSDESLREMLRMWEEGDPAAPDAYFEAWQAEAEKTVRGFLPE